MKINIQIPASPKRTRILAGFMAFLIFALTFQEAFVGWGGIRVSATNSPIDIHSDVKDGSVMAGTVSGIYTYTGKFAKAAVTMFDYVSDEEINGTVVDGHTNSYNNIWHNVPDGGYDDDFTKLNKKISNKNSNNDYSNNITIKFQIKNTIAFADFRNVLVGFYKSESNTSGEPDSGWYPMQFDTAGSSFYGNSKHIQFTFTANYNSIKTALGGGNNHIQHVKFKVNRDNVKSGSNWGRTFYLGLNYWIGHNSNTYVGKTTYFWSDVSQFPSDGNTNLSISGNSSTSGNAENTYTSNYSMPLYFGTFYHGFVRDYGNDNKETFDNPTSYLTDSNSNKPNYNNFWWRANMGLKPQGSTSDLNNGVARGNASVQGLVGQTLSGGDTGNLTDPSDSSIVLPYLNETWSKTNSDVVKYYNADSNGAGVINFPFYEVTASASGNVGSAILGTYNGNYYGTGTSTTQYARFYQFDSAESNLYFNIKDNDPSKKQGYFSETTTKIYSNISNTNYGFFPFNSSTSSYGKANNRGFGAKYVMQFKLKNDGCVGVVDSSGNDLDPSEYKTRIDTIFEFVGDDDLWVFVDGKLVLDMGGAHNKSMGSINFRTKTATVKRAVSIGSTDTDKDNLGVNGANTPVDITTILQTANNKTFVDNDPSKGYNENTTHTMTIFYMERGMNDSNLKIRFNYSPEANFSKMKIAEVTDFSSVNDGLQSYTKIAAENDVFKYTVSNKNTSKSDIYNSSAKYPTAEARTRSNEADSSLQTKLVNGSSQTQSISNFNPPGTLNNGIWSKVDTFKLVSGTSYLWVDGFANNKKMVGITTGSNASNATGASDSGGELYLMYGTNNDLYNSKAEGKESSAEFEKQFSKDSTMLVLQDSNLYSPKRMNGSTPVTPGLISNQNGALFSALTDNGRDVADYYTTNVRVVDRDFAENKSLVNDGVNDYAHNILNNGGQFTFSNDPSGSSADLPVMLTEYFKNTVRTGDLTLTKTVTGDATNTDLFQFKLTLTNVYGKSGNDVAEEGYGNIGVSGAFNASGQPVEKLAADGIFYAKPGVKVTIGGIPYNTHYKLAEIAHQLYENTGMTYNEGNITGTDPIVIDATATNKRKEFDVTAEKEDENGNPLPGAELELWYKENEPPATYSFNDPEIVPSKKIEKTVQAGNSITIPDDEKVTTTIPAITIPSYSYGTDTPPTASDTDWILPRNDSDYIYFRDYNVGSTNQLGLSDQQSFGGANDDNPQAQQSGKRSWRYSWLKRDDSHSQNLEIGFGDENKNAWIAAQFTKNNGQNMVQYAVWERFVDRYTDSNNSVTSDTVVWKIQPPDGYDEVRFCLYYGDQCIRTTERFHFELGKIYHKTKWGKYYSKENNIDCYWDVPVEAEQNTANNDYYWAPEGTAPYDQRMTGTIPNTTSQTYTGTMQQARKYEPTEQKIIFHCNSPIVWHNIHIEFFTSANESARLNGQPFPGYMMEPYAYGGSDYRVGDYLTYELTIPKDATHFRINNGVTGTPYGYSTAITPLRKATTAKSGGGTYANVKNYGNYYKLDTSNYNGGVGAVLTDWNDGPEGLPSANYTAKDVESDYDYIYFEAPNSWGNHIYAYFYGGGNLRADNWQRACYSAWPGVAAAGSEYNDNSTDYYSTTYTYPVADNSSVTGEEYNGTTRVAKASPESTFSNGTTVYKFRVPKGDRTNYSKVIFNNGLSSQSGGKETGVIEYKKGYLYKTSGSSEKHYDKSPTVTYTARTTSGNPDYLYIRMTDSTYSTWDDLHITFYDNNDRQILQSGNGYIMDYSGSKTDSETTYKYFCIPIPADATRFKLNNGMKKNSAHTKETGFYDILRKGSSEPTTSNDYTKGKIVYELADTTLTIKEPVFTVDDSISEGDPLTITGTQNSFKDYTSRGDQLKILDSAPLVAAADGIGAYKVKFYDASGNLIHGTTNTSGTYVLIQSKPDANGKRWYTIDIPTTAASFTLTYPDGTTSPYDIYPYSPNGDGKDASNNDIVGSWTSDGMYYETNADGSLSVIESTVSYTKETAEANDETYAKRGDYLYLVCATAQKSNWTDDTRNMLVTFYGADGAAIQSGITAKYQADKDGDSWFKVSIPADAAYFAVTGAISTTKQAEIYPLKHKLSRYTRDYTLGDMQYRLPTTTGNAPTLLYPVFTEDASFTTEMGGETISTRTVPLVDRSAITDYEDASAGTIPATDSSSTTPTPATSIPVLYATSTVSNQPYTQNVAESTVTKNWTEGGLPSVTDIFFYNTVGWTEDTVKIKYYYADSSTATYTMTKQTPADSNGYYTYTYPFDPNATDVKFYNGNNTSSADKSEQYNVANKGITYGSMFTPRQTAGLPICLKVNDVYSDKNWYAHFWKDGGSEYTSYSNDPEGYNANGDGGTSDSGVIGKWWSVPVGYDRVQFYTKDNGTDLWRSQTLNLNSGNNYGRGKDYKVNSDSEHTLSPTSWSHSNVGNNAGNVKGDWSIVTGGGVGNNVNYSATYQPEDRYGYISNINGTSDINNFIYIDTTIEDPYVVFYTGAGGTGDMIGGKKDGTGSIVCGAKADETGTANLYRVRLPKNAASFKIADGATVAAADLSSAAYNLTQTDLVVSADGTYPASGNSTTIASFHHAGSTFNVAADKTITLKSVRANYTVGKSSSMTDPLNPKTDADFIFFTDTDDTLKGSGTDVYAYFYGAEDGEYKTWPGVKATTADSATADTHYTDNEGKTVYVFRVPQGNDGKYSKVIFTNGAPAVADRKITAAADITAGTNYVLGTTASGQYGAFTSASPSKVYPVTTLTKASTPTDSYSIAGSTKTIYIVNNGTQNLTNGQPVGASTDRFSLDEMHVVFYDANKQVIGNDAPGYKPDKVVGKDYSGSPVYRITAPSNAAYFQITNGDNKTATNSDSKLRERQSEIKELIEDGLYKFVDEAYLTSKGLTNTAANYIESTDTVPANEAARHTPNYLLGLINEIPEGDEEIPDTKTNNIHIATIVTGNDGKQEYIKWLRPDPSTGTGVDTKYLATPKAAVADDPDTDEDETAPAVNQVYDPDTGTGVKCTTVKVVASGEYYWKEGKAPTGYQKTDTEFPVEDGNATVTDRKIVGKLKLVKELADGMPSTLNSQTFVYTVNLTAPTGKKYVNDGSVLKIQNTDGSGEETITVKKFDHADNTTGEDVLVNATITDLTVPTGGATASFKVSVSKDSYVLIENLLVGTGYTVSETQPSANWSEKTHSGTSGSIVSASEAIASYTNVKTMSLTVTKTIDLTALTAAQLTELESTLRDQTFDFTVDLSNTELSLSDYTFTYSQRTTNVDDFTPAASTHPLTLSTTLKGGQSATISGIPVGTQYQVKETGTGGFGWSVTGYTVTDTDNSNTATSITVTTADPEVPYREIADGGSSVGITNKYEEIPTEDFTLSKQIVGKLPKSISDVTATPYYKFHVTLTPHDTNGFAGYSITIPGSNRTITTQTDDSIVLDDIYLKDGESFEITGLPENTAKVVTEDNHFYVRSGASAPYTYTSHDYTTNGTYSNAPDVSIVGGTVKNQYPVKSLALNKELANGTELTAANKDVAFKYRVTLDRSSIAGGNNVDLREYVANPPVSGATYPTNESTNYTADTIVFDVNVSKNSPVTIPDIPVGTSYTVEEIIDNGTGGTQTDWAKTAPASATVTGTIVATTTASDTNSATFTNIRYGSLQLTKVLEINAGGGSLPNDSRTFTFHVKLTAPAGLTISGLSGKTNYSGTTTGTGDALRHIYQFDETFTNRVVSESVQPGAPITISNLPYGTDYEVYEVTTGLPVNIVSDHDSNNKIKSIENVGITTTNQANIENTYYSGKLTITKVIDADNGVTKPNGGTYQFSGTFTNANIDLRNYTINGVTLDTSSYNPSTGAINFTATVTVPAGSSYTGSLEISGIPYGTSYTVSEDARTDASTSAKTAGNDSGTIGTGVDETTTGTVTFTNTYHKTVDLYLRKLVSTNGTLPTSVNTSTTQYTLKVNLQSATGFTNYTVTLVDGDGTTSTVTTPTGDIIVTLKHNQTAHISGLPADTQYKVSETNGTANTTAIDGQVSTFTNVDGASTSAAPYDITNYYNVGSLALSKVIKTNYYNTATSEEQGNIPTAISGKDYYFWVTLTVSKTINLDDYLTFSSFAENQGNDVYRTVDTSGSTTNSYTFKYKITGAHTGEIKNIPVGTTWSVYEDGTNTDYLTTTNRSASPVSSASALTTSGDSASITNTYSYGTLKVKKTAAGLANAHVTPADVYTFKVELTEPDGVKFNLPVTGETAPTPSNPYSIIGLGLDNSYIVKVDYDNTNKYTIIMNVPKNGTEIEIEYLPYGTGYKVTEVVLVSGSYVSVTDSSKPDPNNPYVTNNEATGTLNETEETADITNTYRKVTLTKTDAKDNARLNGAKYVLLKLKDNYQSVTGYTEASFLAALKAATESDFASSTAFANSGLAAYCDGYSVVKTTEGTASNAGMLTIDDSEMSCGLTAGKYFFLELSAPTYYKRNVDLNKIFTLSATGDTDNTYIDAKSYTNERKTGSLELQKALASGTADDGVTNTVQNQNTEFTYHVVLKAPVGVTLGTGTGKYPIAISNAIGTAPTPSYETDANDNRSTCTIDLKVKKKIASNALPTISGIPYGTEYVVTEPNMPSTGNAALHWVQTGKSGDEGTFTDTTEDTVTKTAVFTNGLTGELEITKHIVPSTSGATVTDKECTFEVTFLPDESATGTTLSKYTLTDGSGNTLHLTGTNNNKLSVTIENVSTTSNDKTFTIKGIPLGMQYQVQETNSGGATSTTYELNNSGSEVTGATTTAATVSASAPAQKVKFTNTYVVTANTGSLKLIKTLKGDYGSYNVTNTTPFTFNVTLTPPTGYDLSQFNVTSYFPNKHTMTYNSGTKGYSGTIPVTDQTDVVIGNLPADTQCEVWEASPTNAVSDHPTASDKIQKSIVTDSTENAEITNTYPGSLTITKKVTGGYPTTLPASYSFSVTFDFPDTISSMNLDVGETSTRFDDGQPTTVTISSNNTTSADGNSVKIKGIPLGTTYTVTENTDSLPSNATVSYANASSIAVNETNPSRTATVTNEYPSKYSLQIDKSRVGNIPTESEAQNFTVRVTFTPNKNKNDSTDVDLSKYLTGTNLSSYKVNGDPNVYDIPISVTKNSASGSYTISNIPAGTGYSITETTTGAFTTAYDDKQSKTQASGGITANTTTTVTNKYRKIEITKNDEKQNGTTDIPVSGAKYVLVKLTDVFYNYYTSLAAGSDEKTAIENTFKSATAVTDLTYTPSGESLAVPCYEVVSGSPVASSEKTTGSTSPNVGKFTVTDSDIIGGLQDGGHYFFLEVAPAADSMAAKNYKKNNTLSADKIITIGETTYSYTPTYTDPRKTGTLELEKTLASGTETEDTFTYNVTISRPTTGNNDFDLTKYFVRRDVSSTTYLDSGAHSIAVTECSIAAAEVSFKVTMTAETNQTIYGIPYGAEYTVTESNPTAPANTTWQTVSSSGLTGTVYNASAETDPHKAAIKNGLVGSIKLKKTVRGVRPNNPAATYPFKVKLESPTENFTGYSISVDGGSLNPLNTTITHNTEFTVDVTPAETNNEHIVTISGVPYGTTFSIYENSQNDGSTSNHTENGTGTNAPLTGTVEEDTPVQEITNTYPYTGELKLQKRLAGGTRPAGVPDYADTYTDGNYVFVVTLTNSSVDLEQYTFTAKNGNNAAVTVSKSTSNNGHNCTLTMEIAAGSTSDLTKDITISGIPRGTTYSVEELSASQAGTVPTTGVDVNYNNEATHQIADTQKTVTVTNTYPETNSLTLSKALVPGTPTDKNDQGTTSAPLNPDKEFTFEVDIKRASGATHVDLKKYLPKEVTGESPNQVTTIGGKTVESNTVHQEDEVKFTIKVKQSQNITFSNLPVGTTYTVKETDNLSSTNWVKVTPSTEVNSVAVDQNGTINTSESIAEIKNGLTGSMKITKTLAGDTIPSGAKEFWFTVTLTNNDLTGSPSNVPFSRYTFTQDSSNTSLALTGTNSNVISVKISLADGIDSGETVIHGIPYGTSCKVEETTSGNFTTTYKVGASTGDTVTVNSTTEPQVDVTNTYNNSGTLTLKKKLEKIPSDSTSDYPDGITTNTPFILNVVLTNDDVDLTTYFTSDYLATLTGVTAYTDNSSKYSEHRIELDVSVKDSDASGVSIGHIPPNTHYDVTESDHKGAKSSVLNIGNATTNNTDTVSGAITDSVTSATVTAKNTYYPVSNLTISKTVSKNNTSTVPGDTKYVFTVTLSTPPTTLGTDPYKVKIDGNDVTSPITVELAGDESVTINNIPVGTTYSVVETGIKKPDPNNAGQYLSETTHPTGTGLVTSVEVNGTVTNDINTTGNKTIAAANTVAFTNTYKDVGKLSLSKVVEGTTPTPVPTNYLFHVTLYSKTLDLTNYDISATGLTGGSHTDYTYTEGGNSHTQTNGKYEFNVPVAPGGTVEVSNIPYGTQYTVSETQCTLSGNVVSLPEGMKTRGEVAASPASTISSTNSSPDVTIYNAYTGTLTLNKVFAGSVTGAANSKDDTPFTFRVRLTPPTANGISNFDNYTITQTKTVSGAETTTSVNWVTSGGDKYFDIEVTKKTPVRLNGIPYGTSYTIEEVNYSSNVVPDGSISSTTIDATHSAQTETITNTYVGSLTLEKKLYDDNRDSGNSTTYTSDEQTKTFKYHVKLSNNTTDVNLTKYIAKTPTDAATLSAITKIGGQNVVSGSVTAYGEHNIEFDINVTSSATGADNKITFSGIPHGTSYIVTEAQTDGWANVASSDNTSSTIDADTAKTVTFTNAKAGELKLEKGIAANSSDSSHTTDFIYQVVLTAPSGIKLRNQAPCRGYQAVINR